ncbi:MAG: O-antigen ligase family protein [Magnetococcales bacterium]|nr:O-antigen ligase family protein [Magnetococcales bacterium]
MWEDFSPGGALPGMVSPGLVLPERDRWLFRGFALLVLLVPLPLGSNRPWAWLLMEVGIFGLFTLWALSRARRPEPLPRAVSEHPWPLFLLLLWSFYPLVQVVPLPMSVLEILSPSALEIRRFVGQEPLATMITLDLHATLTSWLKGIAYFMGLWLVLVLVNTRRRLSQLAYLLVVGGAFQGLFAFVSGREGDVPGLVGTFVNRNHLAGYLELTLPVVLGLLLSMMAHRSSRESGREPLLLLLGRVSGRQGVLAMLAVLMLLAVLMSRSRSGSVVLLVSLFLVSWLARWRSRPSTRERRLLMPLFFVSLVAGAWLGLGNLTQRFLVTDLRFQDRWLVFEETWRKVLDYPLVGSGSGTFGLTFPLYRDGRLAFDFVDHAHNDYLEILADQGILGFGLMTAAFVFVWVSVARAYLQRRDPFARGMLFASLASTLALALHAATDFNFQIPANALTFMVLLGLGLAAATVPHAEGRGGARRAASREGYSGSRSGSSRF